MNALRIASMILATAASTGVYAQASEPSLGSHPAVIVKQLAQSQGYDYAAKFYPHPAWLHLSAEAPRPMMDHPAVTVFRRDQQEQANRFAAKTTRIAAAR